MDSYRAGQSVLFFLKLGIDSLWTQCYSADIKNVYTNWKEVNIVSPKMGQKLTDNPKDTTVKARMDKETLEKLDRLAAEHNSDRSKIIRQGIEMQYEQRNKK